MLWYLKGSTNILLVLSTGSLTSSWWWVDAASAVHHDCKGHTGYGGGDEFWARHGLEIFIETKDSSKEFNQS